MGKKYEKERAGGDSMQCAGGVVVMIPPDGEREPAMLMAEEFRGEGLCVLELEMSDLSTTRMEDMSVNSKESAYMFEAWVKRSGARMLLRMEAAISRLYDAGCTQVGLFGCSWGAFVAAIAVFLPFDVLGMVAPPLLPTGEEMETVRRVTGLSFPTHKCSVWVHCGPRVLQSDLQQYIEFLSELDLCAAGRIRRDEQLIEIDSTVRGLCRIFCVNRLSDDASHSCEVDEELEESPQNQKVQAFVNDGELQFNARRARWRRQTHQRPRPPPEVPLGDAFQALASEQAVDLPGKMRLGEVVAIYAGMSEATMDCTA